MTLKHVLKHFSKTEVQEDKTHPTPPLEREGVKVSYAEHTEKNLSSNRLIVLTTLKKAAFTLAEVLITLGIIGVVAALTLPTLIQNHKKQTYVNQLKKVVNTLENAAQMAVADEGVSSFRDTLLYCALDTYNCASLGTENSEIEQNLSIVLNKYFKTISVYVPPELSSLHHFYINGSSMSTGYVSKMVLSDGAVIYLLGSNSFFIDINGDKGPNTYGRDLVGLGLNSNGRVQDFSHCSTFVDNGGDVVESNQCFYYKIVADGWKMNY